MSNNNEIPPIDGDRGELNSNQNNSNSQHGNGPKKIMIAALVAAVFFGGSGIAVYSLFSSNDNSSNDIELSDDAKNVALESMATSKNNAIASAQAEILREQQQKQVKQYHVQQALLKQQAPLKQADAPEVVPPRPPVDVHLLPPEARQGFANQSVEIKTDSSGRQCKVLDRDGKCPPTVTETRQSGPAIFDIGGDFNNSEARPQSVQHGAVGSESYDTSLDMKDFASGSANQYKNQSMLLVHGTNVPIILKTEIITDYPGLITAQVSEDIYSMNGSVLLVERGSTVNGVQKKAMVEGIARVFVQWTNIVTPLGVKVSIDSLGTGQLGASGSSAWIDSHYAQRFGGAILLSFIEDTIKTGTNKMSSDGVTFDTENSTDNLDSMAKIALQNSIDIKPTGYVPIGTRMNILIARDIDFSKIYSLERI